MPYLNSLYRGIAGMVLSCFVTSCEIKRSPHTIVTITLPIVYVIIIAIVVIGLVTLFIFVRKRRKRSQDFDYDGFESLMLHVLIDNMPDFIYIKDTRSRFVLANKHTVSVLHAKSFEEVLGKTDYDFYPKNMADKFFSDEQKIIQTRESLINIEEDGFDPDNNRIFVSTTKVPWIDRNNRVLGIIGIGRNVTRFKEIELKLMEQANHLKEVNTLLEEKHEHINHQAEELTTQSEHLKHLNDELHKINETKDKFISIIAHDLKNPFNAIINFSELLMVKGSEMDEPRQSEMISIINSSSKIAYSLLENLLYWGKNQSASIPFNPARLNANEVVSRIIEFQEVSAQLKNIKIINDTPPDSMVYADPDMLTTILRNLLSNAIKFTPKNGEIKITSRDDNKFGIITLSDNGIGIPADQLDKLFKPIKEITKGTTGESGTGLGLLLCKEFAVRNGGDISVKSEVDKGSSFILSLPLPADF